MALDPPSRKRKDPGNTPNNGNSAGGGSRNINNGRSAKRVKIWDAREIRVQSSDAALDADGNLDLQGFLAAREFEIGALEASMRKCKSAGASRAFQQVPSEMRRRSASHNAHRVPKRLHARARREQDMDNTPTVEARRRRPRTTRARIRAETAKRLHRLAERKRKKAAARAKEMKEKAEEEKVVAVAAGGAGDGEGAGGDGSGGKEGKDGEGKRTREKLGVRIQTRPARPKIRRNLLNEPPHPAYRFRKRQLNKTWLPTHIWHAKRARMTEPSKPLWRFAIPITPSAKSYRPTHRASGEKGTVIWDTSYMSTIGLYGSASGVEAVLRTLGVEDNAWGGKGKKWRAGFRSWTGTLSRLFNNGIRRDIGPATVVWNPEMPASAARETDVDDASAKTKKPHRQVLLRTHPSCFMELFSLLVKLVKMHKPKLYIEDLRYEIGSIELIGPGSTEALIGILHPYSTKEHDAEQHGTIFKSLTGLTNPGSLARNAILAFSAADPRLTYPPKPVDLGEYNELQLVNTVAKWPVEENSKPISLLDRDARFRASRLPTSKSLNRRKGARVPGTNLAATDADPPIPILLLATKPPRSSASGAGTQIQGTWTLLTPWQCILPFWLSLVHYPLSSGGNPRVGGLDEARQVAFEQRVPWFPADFPATDAGAAWEAQQRADRRRAWERRPKGKRVAWDSLDLGSGAGSGRKKGEVGDGLACDFEYLFALGVRDGGGDGKGDGPGKKDASKKRAGKGAAAAVAAAGSQTLGSIAEADSDAMDLERTGAAQGRVNSTMATLMSLNHVSKASFNALITSQASKNVSPAKRTLLPNSVVTVRLTLMGRGVATACARIYRLPTRSQPQPQQPQQPQQQRVSSAPANPSSIIEVPATSPAALQSPIGTQVPQSSSPALPQPPPPPPPHSSSSPLQPLLASPPDPRTQWLRKLPPAKAAAAVSRPPGGGNPRRGGAASFSRKPQNGRRRGAAVKPDLFPPSSLSTQPPRTPLHADKGRGNTQVSTAATKGTLLLPTAAAAIDPDSSWEAQFLQPGGGGAGAAGDGHQHHPPCPGKEDLLGFVTTGSFNLGEGRATALATLSAERALEALAEARGEGGGGRDARDDGRLCVVRRAGEAVGWLARWEVV